VISAQRRDHQFGLRGRHDPVLGALEESDRRRQPVGVANRERAIESHRFPPSTAQ
jgi:hypothetical protein